MQRALQGQQPQEAEALAQLRHLCCCACPQSSRLMGQPERLNAAVGGQQSPYDALLLLLLLLGLLLLVQ